jgi:hypothetical protein
MYYSSLYTSFENTQQSYTSVEPSGPGNTPLVYSSIGKELATHIKSGEALMTSQILRIATQIVNGNAWLQALTDADNKFTSGVTGSFSVILVRLLAMLYAQTPLLGPEASAAIGNMHFRLASPLNITLDPNYWPLSNNITNTPSVVARVCTYNDYAAIRYGTQLVTDLNFLPANWGSSVAIVPIGTDLNNRGGVVAAWTLAHMEYPWRFVRHSGTVVDDDYNTIAGSNGYSVPAASCMRVRGPTAYVLFVQCGASGLNTNTNNDNVSIEIGIGGALEVVTYQTNGLLLGAALDITAALDTIVGTNFLPQAVLEALFQWQIYVGNEEDLRTAILVVSDHAHRVAPPAVMTGGVVTFGYYYAGSGTPFWNTTGWTSILSAPYPFGGMTCPLGAYTTRLTADVANGVFNASRIGQLDCNMEVDMMHGLMRPSHPVRQKMPQTVAGVATMLRKVARIQSLALDACLKATGIPMNQLFNPSGGAAQAGAEYGHGCLECDL